MLRNLSWRLTTRMMTCLGLLLLLALPAIAQEDPSLPSEFATGNDRFQIYVYVALNEVGAPAVTLLPGEGMSGRLFRDRPDGGESWMSMLQKEGFNAFAADYPGSCNAPATVNEDYIRALKGTVEGVYSLGRGAIPRLSIACAEGAALLIKTRSFEDIMSRTAVLIDPVGPQFAQPLERMTLDEALAARDVLDDTMWQRWGFGPRAGVLGQDLDIDLATAREVADGWDRKHPPLRPALLQPMISPIAVRGPDRLKGWPVMIVRTPAADAAQVRREDALAEWLEQAGAVVTRLDMRADPELAHATGLPWIGSTADVFLDRILKWHRRAVLLAPAPSLPTRKPGS